MCLQIKDREIKTATEDITVYKILSLIDGSYWSPFYTAEWLRGETKTVDGFASESDENLNNLFTDEIPKTVSHIGHGLHSFVSKSVADNYKASSEVIVECHIPEGTKYITGSSGELVSLALKFVEVVSDARSY